MKPLQLPANIRAPRADEIPSVNPAIVAKLKERETANLVEGYIVKSNSTGNLPFKFFAEINIDNDRLWSLFKKLADTFPERIGLVYGHIDDKEISYSTTYIDKEEVIRKLEKYERELTQDGYLEFGITYHDEDVLIETYVKKGKYIQYWGMDYAAFEKIMEACSLTYVTDLNFVDEYPVVTETLTDALSTDELIEYFRSQF
jgi:hypothetical protein